MLNKIVIVGCAAISGAYQILNQVQDDSILVLG